MVKAAVFRGAGAPLTIEDVQIDSPGPREILVRTAAVRRLPQRPALRRRPLPDGQPGDARP